MKKILRLYAVVYHNKKENYPSIAFDQMNKLEQKEAPEKIDSENNQDSLIETELNKYIEYYGNLENNIKLFFKKIKIPISFHQFSFSDQSPPSNRFSRELF